MSTKKTVPPRYFNFPLGLFQFAIFQCDPPGGGAVSTSIFEPTYFASISTTSMMSGKNIPIRNGSSRVPYALLLTLGSGGDKFTEQGVFVSSCNSLSPPSSEHDHRTRQECNRDFVVAEQI